MPAADTEYNRANERRMATLCEPSGVRVHAVSAAVDHACWACSVSSTHTAHNRSDAWLLDKAGTMWARHASSFGDARTLTAGRHWNWRSTGFRLNRLGRPRCNARMVAFLWAATQPHSSAGTPRACDVTAAMCSMDSRLGSAACFACRPTGQLLVDVSRIITMTSIITGLGRKFPKISSSSRAENGGKAKLRANTRTHTTHSVEYRRWLTAA